jgi:enoyl-CoA hydratase/carnithine racemase
MSGASTINSDRSRYTTSNLVFNYVRIERRDAIATLVLDRPERLNAVEATMRGEIVRALRQLVDDARVRVVVLTGAGRAFCAGADIAYLRQLKEEEDLEGLAHLVDAGGEAALLIRGAPKPVIAAVNGPAAGGGANLALACDLRIASQRASIGQTFVRIGLQPDWGGTFFLPRIVGASRALELMWTGRMVEAQEALELGLFDRVVPAEELEGEVARLAGALAAAAPEAMARIKAAVYAATGDDLDGALARERQSQIALFRGTDADEGLRAFLEKRAPVFGRGAGAGAGAGGAAARRPERG